jgi:hypothetical protein
VIKYEINKRKQALIEVKECGYNLGKTGKLSELTPVSFQVRCLGSMQKGMQNFSRERASHVLTNTHLNVQRRSNMQVKVSIQV